MHISNKHLRLESRGFRNKVALYLNHLHIKFDDQIKANPYEFQAYVPIYLCPKLNWRLGLASLQPDFAVTETCNTNLWQPTNV